ncbi:MAG: DNA primase [Rickettsiales bacterium]|nr:DNA primase [Rickettsiales bacterium]
MRYPKAFIDSVKSRFAVSDIVGRHVSLRRNGREFTGLCPFHKEKTPSFTVSDEKGFFHCFGCGAHGDAIGFVKDFESISYVQAIEKLAHEAGMELPQLTPEEIAKDRKRRSLLEVLELASQWFEAQLLSPSGYIAQQYLDKRGLSVEMVQKFRIGFAPDDRQALLKFMRANQVEDQQLIDAGLMIRSQEREDYSRFRARLIFPIRDYQGQVIAFGGRVLPNLSHPDAPKYLNSPETECFHKGQQLYNYDLARKSALDKREIIVCEGYMDVISLAQAGIENAVAPLGTAITEPQLHMLWQTSETPSLCLDGDAAGERAMQRASELALPLLQPGKSLRFVTLPKGDDPDTLVRRHGAEYFLNVVETAPALAEMLWQRTMQTPAKTPEEAAGQEQHLMALADRIAHPTVKSHYRSFFKDKLWKDRSRSFEKGKAAKATIDSDVPTLPQTRDQNSRLYRSVVKATQIVLLYPQILEDAQAEETYASMEIIDEELNRLRQHILNIMMDSSQVDRLYLHKELVDRGLKDQINQCMKTQGVFSKLLLEDSEALMLTRAKRMWQQALNAYSLAFILEEFKEAEAEMARNMNELNLSRFMELKSQLEQLEAQRGQMYQEEMFEEA